MCKCQKRHDELWVGVVIEVCGLLGNGAEGPRRVGGTFKLFACAAQTYGSDCTRLHVQRRGLGALFGSMTTWITTIIENHTLQAWLYAIHWRAITLLRYRVNSMKAGAKTQQVSVFT